MKNKNVLWAVVIVAVVVVGGLYLQVGSSDQSAAVALGTGKVSFSSLGIPAPTSIDFRLTPYQVTKVVSSSVYKSFLKTPGSSLLIELPLVSTVVSTSSEESRLEHAKLFLLMDALIEEIKKYAKNPSESGLENIKAAKELLKKQFLIMYPKGDFERLLIQISVQIAMGR